MGAMRSISSTGMPLRPARRRGRPERRAASSTTTCTLSPSRIAPFTPSRAATHVARGAGRGRDDREDLAGHQRLQRSRRVAIEHPALAQETEPRAALRLVEVGGGDHDRDALPAQTVEDAPEIAPRHRIDAGGRLVEQQHLAACG